MIPALRTRLPCASRSSVAAISPFSILSSWAQGLRSPVTSTTALVAEMEPGPGGEAEQIDPAGGDVLAHRSGQHGEARLRNSSCSSAWIRWTWRRLGWVGSRATRERCLTVAP